MRRLTLVLALLCASAAALAQSSGGSGNAIGGAATVATGSTGGSAPIVTFFNPSNAFPVQGATVTLAYTVTGAASCSINNGILTLTTPCPASPTSAFTPPFSAPGPTVTTYTFCAQNAFGTACASANVTVSAAILSGDDSRYCSVLELAAFPGGVTTDGPVDLFKICNYTAISSTPSPGVVHTVGYSGGVATCGTANADWDTAMSTASCGDIIKVAQGCAKTNCSTTSGCILPAKHCAKSQTILVESVDPATGVPDVGFPGEGLRVTPCDAGLATFLTGYPDYSADCTARGGPKNRLFKIQSTSATTPALAAYDGNAVIPTCDVTTFPCNQGWRLQGLDLTTVAGTRTSHKLLELAGADHMIADRVFIHCQDDPLFRVECQGGVNFNGTHLSLINSWVGPVMCANAPSGTTCIDSQMVAGGVGPFPQYAHKIVNNFGASAGECWFWGGGQEAYFPTADNPDGVVSDTEVRRNFCMHPLAWFLASQSPAITLTAVNTTGVFTGTIIGGTNNALVGKTFKTSGFTNAANNLAVSLVTASTASTISFAATTVTESGVAAGKATQSEPHWDPKNLGETKSTVRGVWEANVNYYSWQGFQSDQPGAGLLITPKNQSQKLSLSGALSGSVLTGSTSSGLFYINCLKTGVACSSSGGNMFTCGFDPNAIPDWTGTGTAVSSCGEIVAFPCTAGTAAQPGPFTLTSVNTTGVYQGTITGGAANALVGWAVEIKGFVNDANGSSSPKRGVITASTSTSFTISATTVSETHAATAAAISNPQCPGSYVKHCASAGDQTRCAVIVGGLGGTYYHIQQVINSDQVQVVENSTSVVGVVPLAYKRALSPFAVVRDVVVRYGIIAHTANGMQISSAGDDGGSEALGVHEIYVHDMLGYDINSSVFDNNNSCCNNGYWFQTLSGTAVPSTAPSDLNVSHNSVQIIGFTSSHQSGLAGIFDNVCRNPTSGTLCANGVVPMFTSGLTLNNNLAAAALHVTNGSGNFAVNTLAFGLGFYGCAGHDAVTGCNYSVHRNVTLQGIWSGQTTQLPNVNLLGSNTVEACSCTTAAQDPVNGHCTGTPGTPATWAWSAPVGTGSLDACDRAAGYNSVFNNYDPNGGPTNDMQLPSNSPYKGIGFGDGLDLGANVSTVLSDTAGVAYPFVYPTLIIDGFFGNVTCTNGANCVLPAATNGAFYTITLHATAGASPYKRWTVVTGSLPTGLTLNAGTGAISGVPTVPGTSTFSAGVEDAAHQTDTQPYALTVN